MSKKQNFDTLFSLELERIAGSPVFFQKKPRLLLHACCAPCSSAVLERLADVFDITVFYYNPNIHPESEYRRRFEELTLFLKKRAQAGQPAGDNPSLIEAEYNPADFFSAVNVKVFPERALEAEQGERCSLCYTLRMEKTAFYALTNGFDYFTTTLSISPHKDAEKINTIGIALEKKLKDAKTANTFFVPELAAAQSALRPDRPFPHYLYADFKKRNGYKRSLEISAEYGLYRQDYCGCIYSKQNTEALRTHKGLL